MAKPVVGLNRNRLVESRKGFIDPRTRIAEKQDLLGVPNPVRAVLDAQDQTILV